MRNTAKPSEKKSVLPSESNEPWSESGPLFISEPGWLLIIALLAFFGAALYWGYKDWQRQRQMRLEFEELLRGDVLGAGAGGVVDSVLQVLTALPA